MTSFCALGAAINSPPSLKISPPLTSLPPPLTHTLPQESPDDALRIFTEDIVEVESLPRQQVLDHLTSVATDLTMPYLVCDHMTIMFISLKPKPHLQGMGLRLNLMFIRCSHLQIE